MEPGKVWSKGGNFDGLEVKVMAHNKLDAVSFLFNRKEDQSVFGVRGELLSLLTLEDIICLPYFLANELRGLWQV